MDNSQNPNANNNGLNTTQNVSGIPNQSTLEQVSFNIGGVEVSAPTAAVQNPAPVAQPVQSAQPIQPSVQPSQPSVQPAQLAAQPAQPAVQPAQPSAQPAQPAAQPAQPAVQPAQPAVQPAQPVVQPAQPAAAVQSSTPVEQNVVQENVNTPISQPESPFFTPVSVQPEVQSSPVLPEPAPVVQPTQPVNPTPTVNQMEVQTNQQEVTNENSNGVEVIQTAPKSKASNVILIIFLVLLILFVLNIDTVISMYDQYKNAKTITNPVNKNTNNLTDGYILINENTSSIKLKDIKFYNFRKSQGKGITFSYEALAKYDNASSLEIYIEIYNSEKEILYKELFNPSQKIEKDTVRTYTLNVENDIFNDAFYALVKIYTDEEKQSKETLTCTLDDEHYQLKNIYIFENKGLLAYEISKTSKDENDESLQKEYEEMKETNSTASFENNTLTYKIELNADNSDTITLYAKDTTLKVIKDKETYKEWKCE